VNKDYGNAYCIDYSIPNHLTSSHLLERRRSTSGIETMSRDSWIVGWPTHNKILGFGSKTAHSLWQKQTNCGHLNPAPLILYPAPLRNV